MTATAQVVGELTARRLAVDHPGNTEAIDHHAKSLRWSVGTLHELPSDPYAAMHDLAIPSLGNDVCHWRISVTEEEARFCTERFLIEFERGFTVALEAEV